MVTQTVLEQAIVVATQCHAGQVDKAGIAYILHPLAVMLEFPGDYTRQAIAVLHDVVEDTSMTLDSLRDLFPPEVVDGVDALTRRPGETYKNFVRRSAQNELAKPVKRADIVNNLLRLTPELEGLKGRYAWALGHLDGVLE